MRLLTAVLTGIVLASCSDSASPVAPPDSRATASASTPAEALDLVERISASPEGRAVLALGKVVADIAERRGYTREELIRLGQEDPAALAGLIPPGLSVAVRNASNNLLRAFPEIGDPRTVSLIAQGCYELGNTGSQFSLGMECVWEGVVLGAAILAASALTIACAEAVAYYQPVATEVCATAVAAWVVVIDAGMELSDCMVAN